MGPAGSPTGRIDEAGQFSDLEEGDKEKDVVVVEGDAKKVDDASKNNRGGERKKEWRVGDLCVAQWREDMVWYNSEILEIVGERVKVRFVEYGNEDYTTVGQLRAAGSLDAVEEKEVKKEDVTEKKEWKIGDLCVAQWHEDGVWYDSQILEIVGERVKVRFVEYGN